MNKDSEPTENDTGRFQCEKCQRVLFSKKAIELHNSMYHLQRKICDVDVKRCVVVKKKSFICSKCGRFFDKQVKLNAHMRSHSEKNIVSYKFKCDVCHKTFDKVEDMSKHLIEEDHQEKNKEKILKCETCAKRLSSLKKYKKHVKKHRENIISEHEDSDDHGNKQILKLICCRNKCGAVFLEEEDFNNHLLIHLYVRYDCSICNTFFKCRRNAIRHEDNHRKNNDKWMKER